MKELNFNLKIVTAHQTGHDLEEMKTFQDLLSDSVNQLSRFLAMLPPAPTGYKWTWDTTKDHDILRLHNFRLVEV